MDIDEPPVTLDRCDYCRHSWHGLPCKCNVMKGYANPQPCGCSSSHPEFRTERESVSA